MPSFALLLVVTSHKREEYHFLINAKLTIDKTGIHYFQPVDKYEIERPFTEIEKVKLNYFITCPILTLWFSGNRKIQLVCFENSSEAYNLIFQNIQIN